MMALSPVVVDDILQVAQATLDDLNRKFRTNIVMKAASVSDLRTWGLNPRFAGFVVQEEPSTIWVVPENVRIPEEARKTILHEFQHILDLTGSCPFCTAPMRELRALKAEDGQIAARPSPTSIQVNKALDEMDAVLGQEMPSDLQVPEKCKGFPDFINSSLTVLVENAKLLGRLELAEREARRRGPDALRRFNEILVNTRLEIDSEREAVLREAVRLAQCMNEVERERMEEKFRELLRPLSGRIPTVSGRVRAINDAIDQAGTPHNQKVTPRVLGAPVRICGPKDCVDVSVALIDTGSTFSTISPQLARQVGFKEKGKRRVFPIEREDGVLAPIGTLEFSLLGKTMDVPTIVMEVKEPIIGATTLEILQIRVDPVNEEIEPVDRLPPTPAKVDIRSLFGVPEEPPPVDARVSVINKIIDEVDGQESVSGRYKLKLQAVIGELVAAQNHLSHLDPDLAARIRKLKKRLQLAIWGRMA